MNTVFTNSGNSKTLDPHKVLLNILEKINFKRSDNYVALLIFSIYYAWNNIKKSCKNNEFKTSATTCNEVLELSDGSNSVSDIQNYFEYIIKKHETVTDNPSIMIYVNKIENRITFKIKSGYYLEILTSETMKSRGSTKSKINKDKNGENVSYLEITKVVITHCNIINNDYQQDSRVFIHLFLINHLVSYLIFHQKNLSFAKNMGKNIEKNIGGNLSKNLSSKCSQKLLDHAKQSAIDTFKTASKRTIQKAAELTGDFIGNKIDNKIARYSKDLQ